MMKTKIKEIVLGAMVAFGILVASVNPSYAAESKCVLATTEQFFSSFDETQITWYEGSPKALAALLADLNTGGKEKNGFLYEADRFVIGVFTDSQGLLTVGLVMFKDGCVVVGSITSLPLDVWVQVMGQYDLDPDKDFGKLTSI